MQKTIEFLFSQTEVLTTDNALNAFLLAALSSMAIYTRSLIAKNSADDEKTIKSQALTIDRQGADLIANARENSVLKSDNINLKKDVDRLESRVAELERQNKILRQK